MAKTLRSRWHSFKRVIRISGVTRALLVALQRTVNVLPEQLLFFDVYQLMACRLRQSPGLIDRLPAGLQIHIAGGPEDTCNAHTSSTVERLYRRAPQALRRLNRGDMAVVAEYKGELAGCVWVAFKRYREEETEGVKAEFILEEPGSVCWDYNSFVANRYRLTPAYAAMWDATLHELHGRGFRWSLSSISVFNPYSLHVNSRMALLRVGKLLFVNFVGLRFVFDLANRSAAWSGPRGVFDVAITTSALREAGGAVPITLTVRKVPREH